MSTEPSNMLIQLSLNTLSFKHRLSHILTCHNGKAQAELWRFHSGVSLPESRYHTCSLTGLTLTGFTETLNVTVFITLH